MKKYIYLVLLLVLAGSVSVYFYINKGHVNVETEKANFTETSVNLEQQFTSDGDAANLKYINKIIEITGIVTNLTENSLVLDNFIFCQMENTTDASITLNSSITIKGRLIGYDDLLEEVKLDQCSLIK